MSTWGKQEPVRKGILRKRGVRIVMRFQGRQFHSRSAENYLQEWFQFLTFYKKQIPIDFKAKQFPEMWLPVLLLLHLWHRIHFMKCPARPSISHSRGGGITAMSSLMMARRISVRWQTPLGAFDIILDPCWEKINFFWYSFVAGEDMILNRGCRRL